MTEYGIFSDEGLVAGDFYDRETAERWMAENTDADDGLHVAEICGDHRDHEKETCEECNTSEEQDSGGGSC